MKIKCVICLLLLLCLVYSQLSAESYWNLSLNEQEKDSADRRAEVARKANKAYENDLIMGYFIALVPGLLVHGAGNIYAGNETRGLILLGVEGVSLVGLYFYALAAVTIVDSPKDPSTAENMLGAVSAAIFLGSWVWDIATVGGEIRKRHPAGVRVEFGALPSIDEHRDSPAFGVNLGIRF
jgi:uncharacterized MAPEG superfamily protein